ncbi:Succinyl-CoA ligase [ADP-forming] subunit alpha [Variovorax sp. SRS16]|uniref:succinate--CoA ligase subunit alpha n=1 Tax=Variovorax sp. SRS16 TaxID=282217 RepID=UPI0013192D09|nr:succinate--CoA ligase subunit alpha [Variovorax sp. SRS16]VTU28191.1 Succinyl-CoA ligase [ADP-forming] subunit alpha [Variovorax sp. SRS16]
MSILVGSHSKILVQGITGQTGRLFAEKMIAGGTPLVGGVTPGKGGSVVAGVPVFDSMREAVEATGADAVLCCIAPAYVLDGMYEVVDAGIPLAVLYIENIPVHDAIRMCAYAKARGTRLLGPNSAGTVSPGRANMSDLNDANLRPGRIGIVSKSGTLTYEVIDELHRHGMGESTVVCLGGDRVIGTDYAEVLDLFEADPETDLVILIGEPGGGLEYPAAAKAATMRTPVVAYITGQASPQDARMGHAGAVVGEDVRSRPQSKMQAFASAGGVVAQRVTDIGALVAHTLARAQTRSS